MKAARKRLEEVEDEAKDLVEKKPWINQTHIDEVLKIVEDIRAWIDEQEAKQKELLLSEDPVFLISELIAKVQRANSVLTRVSNIQKPKEKKAPKKGRNNFKMENVTIDGNEGNWEDFVKFDNGDSEEQQQEEPTFTNNNNTQSNEE